MGPSAIAGETTRIKLSACKQQRLIGKRNPATAAQLHRQQSYQLAQKHSVLVESGASFSDDDTAPPPHDMLTPPAQYLVPTPLSPIEDTNLGSQEGQEDMELS